MVDSNKVPWRAIHEYLLEVGSAKTEQEFFARALSGMDRMIPVDTCSGLFHDDGKLLLGRGVTDSAMGIYNAYYRFRFPFVPRPEKLCEAWMRRAELEGCARIEWSRYADSEYVNDYAKNQCGRDPGDL